jgi:hypothetical protein
MIILEPGEKDTRHNVSKVNSQTGSPPTTQLKENDLIDEFRLIPFLQWMEKADFDGMWGKSA